MFDVNVLGALYARIGRKLLEAKVVAQAVLYAISKLPHMNVSMVLVRPMEQLE